MAGRFSIEAIFKATDRLSRPVTRMGRNIDRLARRSERAMRSVRRMSKSIVNGAQAAGKVLAGVGLAVGIVGAHVVKTGMDFEQAITNVGAVGLQTREQIADLEQKALDLGATTKFTATEAANAMEIMARAGFKNQEILGGVGAVLSAAAASGMEIAEVADHVSNVLKGMGMETKEASRVADVLALASSRTNSSIGSLGESMRNVSSTARQFKIPLEEVVAGVALLQDVGLDASVAGSALNTMLTKLAAPTDALKKKLADLGVTFQDADGNMLPFAEVLANIDKAAKASGGNMDQVALLAELVGLRGQKAAANLKDLFASGKVSTLVEELKGAEGAAEKMASLRMNTLQGDIDLLKSAVDGVSTSLYSLEGGPLRDVVQSLTEWIGNNKEGILDGIQRAIAGVKEFLSIMGGAFMETIEPARVMLSEMFSSSDPENTEKWTATVKELARNLGKLAAFALMVGAAFGALFVSVTVAVNSIVSTVGGAISGMIKFLGDGLFGFINWWQDLFALFDDKGASLYDRMVATGKHIVEGLVKGIKALATAPADMLWEVGKGAWEALKRSVGENSPAKKPMQTGENMGKGLELGLINSLPNIDAAIGQVNSVLANLGPDNDNARPWRREEPPQVVGAARQTAAAVSRSLVENETREQVDLTIRDETGRAEISRRGGGKGGLRIRKSGNFRGAA